ncbi:pre-toxin TG domain-containing protein [Pseudomonas aeruginosa]|uniref:pre-toxin TG domain-containing protein n=1 Tax=Pseudomonas aeruginosa TaxID=287 RepID=UPI000F540833|nr:pre-toxin TG domain-containing protein [Pseudomonas aeruginosa]MBA5106185.1 pre-toxin TG domain-containing protein [Pseudomonas aeruginosa]MBD1300213.1 pre-toxin TG domain-containing protein [Pseudomonas aeruginosa]MBD1340804.1 pre-toxin TG domain-containing protein [Pseudomonas aeruginosa]MBG4604209.1 pre-toxin TG domain-containing protein [Pseudomonas aeruginosa]MBH3592953.1 pre-toxin TG domain-containing protein [Pseudomonas aeruginosa]
MSIMSFRSPRILRAAAIITLTSFLAGCLPQNVKDGGNSLLSGANNVSNGASNLLASIGGAGSTFADITGVPLPGSASGGELREWTDADQQDAEEAYKAFAGTPLDDLPVYDPTKPGELQRYKAKLAELATKYKGRQTLSKDEMAEMAQTVVPLMRFMAKSRAYRESSKKVPNITRDPKGQASVVVPAGMTMEVALLTYCNDHGLPAPWSGQKLHMRSSAPYMPEALRPLYADLHKYAATNPAAHYQMQSTVWWLRGGSCSLETLTPQQKGLIEAAHPGGLAELQSYCTQKKIKGQLVDAVTKQLPGAGAGSMLSQYQQLMQAATDYNTKAQAFLNADLTNPSDLLKLAETSGLQTNLGSKGLFNDPAMRQVLPLLQKSGFAKALTPASVDDKAVAASLSVMEELGRQLGEQQGKDNGSLANYSKLPNGLYVDASTRGGASHAYIKVRNTGTTDLELTGNEFVLTSVDDRKGGHANFRPTQRLSLGPMQPVAIGPNERDAAKRYTTKNEDDVKKIIEQLSGIPAGFESPGDTAAKEQCAEREAKNPGSGTLRYSDFGMGIIHDVIQAAPVVGNVLYGYSAITGKDWLTGSKLSTADRAVALVSAAIPLGGALGGLRAATKAGMGIVGTWKTSYAGYKAGNSVAAGAATGLKAAEGYFAYEGHDACTAWSAGAGAVSNALCIKASDPACMLYNGIFSAIGNAKQVRKDTELETMQEAAMRLEYALAPPGQKPPMFKTPAIIESAWNLFK